MTQQFEDIVIVDLDVQKTTWSRVHSAMRTLYLKLSRDPDIAWNKFFFEERNSRVEVKRHGLWIEDGYIVFDCLLIDVDSHHLPDIRLSMAYANERSRELIQTQREEREQLKAKARDEAEILKSLRANIRDDRESPPSAAAAEQTVLFDAESASEVEVEAQAEPEPAPATNPKPETAPEPEPDTAVSLEEAAQSQFADAAPQSEHDPEPTAAAEIAPPPEPEPPAVEASEVDLQLKRNDWRARFRAAFERNKN